MAARGGSRSFYEAHGLEVHRELRSARLLISDLAASGPIELPVHRHESALLSVLVRGSMRCSCDAQPYAPWIAVYHPPGAAHRTRFSGARAVILELGGRWLDRLAGHAPAPQVPVVLDAQTQWVAARLVSEFRNLRPASLLVIEGLTIQLLAAAARAAQAPDGEAPPWLDQLLVRLQQDFTRDLSLNELAAALNVHPVRMSRVFRRATDRTIGEYVRELRVRHLSDQLATSRETLADLALTAGFYDQSHCTREFKRATGMTPGAYRAMLRSGRTPDATSR